MITEIKNPALRRSVIILMVLTFPLSLLAYVIVAIAADSYKDFIEDVKSSLRDFVAAWNGDKQ